jgi:hypothetical protein
VPGQAPKKRFVSFPASGVLKEILTPAAVGGSGLTACNNLIYHRQGSWGKRCGSNQIPLPNGPEPSGPPVSGYRWYRAYPTPLTKLLVYAQGQIMIGNDANSLAPLGNHQLTGSLAPCFTSARDPQAGGGYGADVVIMTGITLATGSPATGNLTITGLPGTQPSGIYMNINVTDGSNSVTTPNYYILGTDNPASIAAQLVILLNETAAFLNQGSFAPFIGEAYYTSKNPPIGALDSSGQGQAGVQPPSATIFLGARLGGSGGNSITYSITLSSPAGGGATPLTIYAQGQTPLTSGTSSASFINGGQAWEGPCRYDFTDGSFEPLSYMASNPFTQCCTWHDHVWFWGDPNNPDTLFACDIFQPEAFTFMIQNGGMNGPTNSSSGNGDANNGGYQIGQGDGDPGVQVCIPLGNALYVFKTSNIYMIEGYDFQPGEYQFSVTPQVAGYGVPTPYCAAVLENELVFWSGRKYLRLAVGAYEPEHIGLPIPFTEGYTAQGNQLNIRCVAGDIQVFAALTNNFGLPQAFTDNVILYRSVVLWYIGNDQVVVYDDEATQERGNYAWTFWQGWDVGAWVQYGNGPNAAGTNVDPPFVYFIGHNGNNIYRVGGDAADDYGNPIPWMAQTGSVDFASAELLKNAHRVFLNAESQAGAMFSVEMAPGRMVPGNNEVLPYSTKPVTVAFSPTQAPTGGEAFNDMEAYIEPAVQAKSVVFQLTEPGTSTTGFEVVSFGIDIDPEEAFGP